MRPCRFPDDAPLCILSVLVAQRKPLRLSAIVQEIQLETDRSREPYALPMSIAWAILWILQVSGLVRMSLHRFVVTNVGREVYRRIEANSAIRAKDQATHHRARTCRTSAALTEDYQSAMPGLSRRTDNFDPVVRASAGLRLPRRTLRSEQGIAMVLHDQLNRSFTWAEFFLALLISVAPLAATLLVKVLLYRRRRAEGEDGLLVSRRG